MERPAAAAVPGQNAQIPYAIIACFGLFGSDASPARPARKPSSMTNNAGMAAPSRLILRAADASAAPATATTKAGRRPVSHLRRSREAACAHESGIFYRPVSSPDTMAVWNRPFTSVARHRADELVYREGRRIERSGRSQSRIATPCGLGRLSARPDRASSEKSGSPALSISARPRSRQTRVGR